MKTNFQHNSRAKTLSLIDEIYPITSPRHSFPVSTFKQSLKKIGQKNVQDRERKRSGDGRRTDTQRKLLNGGYNIIPRTFESGGL